MLPLNVCFVSEVQWHNRAHASVRKDLFLAIRVSTIPRDPVHVVFMMIREHRILGDLGGIEVQRD